MPICIECRYPVPQLYHVSTSSKSSARPSSPTSPAPGGEAARSNVGAGDVRLTQCPRCKRFADKYVEHDFVVLFIDLVLVKPQVYRHLLFNCLGREDDAFDPSITRIGALLLLFDVYITWSHVESLPPSATASSPIPALPFLAQYVYYLFLCAAMTLSQHLTIRRLAQLPWTKPSPAPTPGPDTGSPILTTGGHHKRSSSSGPLGAAAGNAGSGAASSTGAGAGAGSISEGYGYGYGCFHTHSVNPSSRAESRTTPAPPRFPTGTHTPTLPPSAKANANAVSTALFVSSCMKLFPILMVVWKYDDAGGQLARGVAWAVALQNVEALRILIGCSWWVSAVLIGAGVLVKWVVSRVILLAVGLGEVDV